MKYINSVNDDALIDFRANYNDTNIYTLKEYREWEHKTFDNPKFKFKFHPVTNFSVKVDENLMAKLDSKEKVEILKTVDDYKDSRNFEYKNYPLRKGIGICKAAKPSAYAIYIDGRISKCENLAVPYSYQFIGQLSDDGEFVFKRNAPLWYSGFEFEMCKTCGMYPVCCARGCPTQKFMPPDERPDCMVRKETQMEGIYEWVREL